MTIKKLGHNWHMISDIIANQYIYKYYQYYTKREAIKLFKKEHPNYDKSITMTTFSPFNF